METTKTVVELLSCYPFVKTQLGRVDMPLQITEYRSDLNGTYSALFLLHADLR